MLMSNFFFSSFEKMKNWNVIVLNVNVCFCGKTKGDFGAWIPAPSIDVIYSKIAK